jgi:hypothetical protein
MEKLPRSGPLYNAVEEVYSFNNLYNRDKTMAEAVKEIAKKHNVSFEQLKNILPDAHQTFEGGPIPTNRYPQEVTNVGKGLGAIARGAGKVASKLAGPVGVALTALDLGQALSEVQDKGAAKIAEDYKKEQEMKALAESENMGDRVFEKARMMDNIERAAMQRERLASGARRDYQSSKYSGNPSMKNESTEYSPEERAKLKDMLSKYRAEPTLR